VISRTLEELPEWASELLEHERIARLGLIDATGHPRVLPVTYAISEGAAWTVIDNKPKRSGRELARVRWLRERPLAAITVDYYSDDWSKLRWVQLIGEVVVLDGQPTGPGMAALSLRYAQYRDDPPPGPLLRLAIGRALWWRAT
jgi:PPOX class probable F420-dependent enzyme